MTSAARTRTLSSGSARRRRCTIAIEGIVQGVGFRPLVYRLAVRHALTGTVRNSMHGVVAEVEGAADAVGRFIDELTKATSATARPHQVSVTWGEPHGALTPFFIAASV